MTIPATISYDTPRKSEYEKRRHKRYASGYECVKMLQ